MKKVKVLSAGACIVAACVSSYTKVHIPTIVLLGMSLVVVWGLYSDTLSSLFDEKEADANGTHPAAPVVDQD